MKQVDDVIAAIATPIGEGGISVIRISGNGAINVADKGFRGRIRLQDAKSHTVHTGNYVDSQGGVIDEVLATVFRSPHSYTAEDVVEISCHGGLYVSRKILEAVIGNDARLADPGEFTKRAFLNGRIDLSQAEAVADLIRARSEIARRSSLLQLQGSLSERIKEILNRLINTCGLVELELDFIEDGVTFTNVESLRKEVQQIITELEGLFDSFEYGRFHREGVKVVLIGRPNAGKSSLLNSLLDQNRAIVTEIPGTTRDVIEESIVLSGMLFRLVDTAGLRKTSDLVEKEGVIRTQEQIRQADICLYVVDVSKNDTEDEIQFINEAKALYNVHQPKEIILGNKVDLLDDHETGDLFVLDPFAGMKKHLVSALSKHGLKELTDLLVELSSRSSIHLAEASITVTNERHKNELEKAITSLRLALRSINEAQSGEITAIDLRAAINALGTITGTVTTEDILNSIFSKFCIGK